MSDGERPPAGDDPPEMTRIAREIARRGIPDGVRIPLASTDRVEVGRWQAMRNTAYFLGDDVQADELRPEVDPDRALPGTAITDVVELSRRPHERLHAGVGHALLRAVPALDAVLAHPRVVLLGEPGAGKTALLRDLAARADTPAWLLVDGLDALEPRAARAAVATAIAAAELGRPCVVASRPLEYAALAPDLPWPVVTLAPLTIGQVTRLVRGLCDDLAASGAHAPDRAAAVADRLVAACRPSRRHRADGRPVGWLREVLRTPLAVTAAVLREASSPGRLADRTAWCADLLELLEEWDAARGLAPPGEVRLLMGRLAYRATAAAPRPGRGQLEPSALPGPAARLGLVTRTASAPGDWCRPQLRDCGARHHDVLLDAEVPFEDAVLVRPDPGPSTADRLGFVTLTLQEHCVARYLLAGDPAEVVPRWLDHRHAGRWLEPLLLAAERLDDATLGRLVAALLAVDDGPARPGDRVQRDAVLAARVVVRIAHPDENELARPVPAALRDGVRAALVRLLADRAQPLPEADRIEAADLLGVIGDPRYPVSPQQWLSELRRAAAGAGDGYFCRVTPSDRPASARSPGLGARIGAQEPGDHQDVGRSAGPVLVARYPITWEQWRCMPGAPEPPPAGRRPRRANEPAEAHWRAADAWCAWLTAELRRPVRLLTELEWEAASGCADGRAFPWGAAVGPPAGEPAFDRAWTFSSRTRYGIFERSVVPVGCYPAGAAPTGVLDLVGNAAEWTSDAADAHPLRRVQRGGDHTVPSASLGCRTRAAHATTGGLRVALDPPFTG